MDQQTWNRMTPLERTAVRDLSGLHPQLLGLEGYRVEVETVGGSVYRFQVGRSTGWKPCHLSLHNSRSHGGDAINPLNAYVRVTKIRKVR